MVNKKGYFYLVEIMLVVLTIVIFILYMPESERKHTLYEEQENIKAIGYGALFALDEQGIMNQCLKENISESSFIKLKEHIETSIYPADIAKIEYYYSTLDMNYTDINCLNSTGQTTICGDFPRRRNEIIVSVIYTFSRNPDPITIKLYLRRYVI